MCMTSSRNTAAAAPVLPPEPAAMRMPDGGAALKTAAERRTATKVSGATGAAKQMATILTSGKGVTSFAPTEKKTLLGQ